MRWLAALALALPLAAAAQAPDFARLVREQGRTVVSIAASYATPAVIPDLPHDEVVFSLLEQLAGAAPDFEVPPLGSGFVVSADGEIVTAYHIIEDAWNDEVIVRLADGRELIGRVVGGDPASDIALVRVRASGLPTAHIGDPSRLQPGEWVAAIGAPFGFEQTVVAGIVSTISRPIPSETHVRFIQTDAAINPGHSGGPLFNLRGEVIGVNSRMLSPSGGSVGLSFAVPIDVAMAAVDRLRATGDLRRWRMGVSVQAVSAELAQAFRLESTAGALVTAVESRSAAERAGLRPGDVVVRFGDKPVRSHAELLDLAAQVATGSEVALELVRDGNRQRAVLRVTAREAPHSRRADIGGTDRLGFSLASLPESLRRHLGVEGGAMVRRAEGAARRAGFYPGDVILAVNGEPVQSAAKLNGILDKARSGESAALLVERSGIRAFVPLRIP